ncbi:hypothetical protein LY78DRAFT_174138 [Colletotrichum sublineola]|nr:hypothetical protein LY78DRAFT_174138 [Colletotrichum sublineola]
MALTLTTASLFRVGDGCLTRLTTGAYYRYSKAFCSCEERKKLWHGRSRSRYYQRNCRQATGSKTARSLRVYSLRASRLCGAP